VHFFVPGSARKAENKAQKSTKKQTNKHQKKAQENHYFFGKNEAQAA